MKWLQKQKAQLKDVKVNNSDVVSEHVTVSGTKSVISLDISST